MKKSNVMIAVFAVMTVASVARAGGPAVNFDGATRAYSTGSQTDTDFTIGTVKAAPVTEASGMVPARTYPGSFVAGNKAALDRTIDSAITYAKENRRSPELIAGLECLLKNGTVDQKEAFVYGPSTYVLPDSCVARPAQPQLKCISSTVCSWITETIIRTSCNPNGECMDTTVDVLRKTCENLCD